MKKNSVHVLMCVGLLWGLAESGLYPYLKTNYTGDMTGSIMAGFSFLFIATAYTFRKKFSTILVLLGLISGMKVLSAVMLGMPICHTANPIYAYGTEAMGYWLVTLSLEGRGNIASSLLGTMSAALAVVLFPLVSYCTGDPACIKAGTTIPLAFYYAYLAVGLATITVPVGIFLGNKIEKFIHTKYRVPIFLSLEAASAIAFLILNITNG